MSKIKDIAMLMKLRLSFLVVISAIACYFFAGGGFDINLLYMTLGGFLITGASNGYNQVIERDIDKLMTRTMNRPMPQGRLTVTEGLVISSIFGIAGAFLLFQINWFSGVLGILAMFLYAAVYTPLKPITPWAVFVGAFPGAIPPMIGIVAFDGFFSFKAGILFFIQFIWQFPHFWAIAWLKDDDYRKAGFSLLPLKSGKSKKTLFLIVIYTAIMVPVGILPWYFEWAGDITLILGTLAGIWFFMIAYKFYLVQEDKWAKKLMFASFIYLPFIQFLYVFDKLLQ
ncbi:heme o synthase [Paracrocinitomix mangrovi]|uniref:heme o synthase n=1 Tax=Paracrocinitomix mangrovi TaxID=2862509 RepID=UPI001C8D74AD|nr:heme o synthase [Paracrocinitomix mangrovi]UKN03423.1 heme o synthase [Paracrocinitomix mangrovi]